MIRKVAKDCWSAAARAFQAGHYTSRIQIKGVPTARVWAWGKCRLVGFPDPREKQSFFNLEIQRGDTHPWNEGIIYQNDEDNTFYVETIEGFHSKFMQEAPQMRSALRKRSPRKNE